MNGLVTAPLLLAGIVVLACAAPAPGPGTGAAPATAAGAASSAANDREGETPGVAHAGDELRDVHGKVEKVSDEWFGLVPDGELGQRYAPDRLPEEFRQDGLRVVFSGVVGEIPPNVRLWGTPLELSAIARER